MNVREAGYLGSTSEQEAKMARTRIGGTIASMLLLGSVVTALPGEAKYRILAAFRIRHHPIPRLRAWTGK